MDISEISFGVVLYDSPEDPDGEGWASVAGAAPQRITGKSLDTAALWWSNLSRTTIFNNSLNRTHVKAADFLTTNLRSLAVELGLEAHGAGAEVQVAILSEVFDRTMRLARSRYEITYDKLRNADYLSVVLYHPVLGSNDMLPLDEGLLTAVAEAYKPRIRCSANIPSGHVLVRFTLSRMAHAANMMSIPVPGSVWQHYSHEQLMDIQRKNHIDFLMSLNRPILAKATFQMVSPEYAPLIVSGNQTSWMTQPELLFMHRFAKVTVREAYVGNVYEMLRLRAPLFQGDHVGPLSISSGLLAEAVAHAAAGTRPWSPKQPKINKQHIIHPRAAWISAADRFHCLSVAACLRAIGYTVREYGCGSVLVAVKPNEMDRAREYALQLGLLPPVGMVRPTALARAA